MPGAPYSVGPRDCTISRSQPRLRPSRCQYKTHPCILSIRYSSALRPLGFAGLLRSGGCLREYSDRISRVRGFPKGVDGGAFGWASPLHSRLPGGLSFFHSWLDLCVVTCLGMNPRTLGTSDFPVVLSHNHLTFDHIARDSDIDDTSLPLSRRWSSCMGCISYQNVRSQTSLESIHQLYDAHSTMHT